MIETLPAWLTAEQARLLTRAAEILEAEHHVCEAQVVRMVAYALPAPLAREHVEALRSCAADEDEECFCRLWSASQQSGRDSEIELELAHMAADRWTAIRAALRALGVE